MGHYFRLDTFMSKEAQPFSIDQLQNKIGKIYIATENVGKAFGEIGPSNFARRTENLSSLDETKPEDRIYMLARLGRARKKIKEVTIPFLNSKREDYEADISELKINDAQGSLNQLASLHEDGYISQEELETANNEFESLRPRHEITQQMADEPKEEVKAEEDEKPILTFSDGDNSIEIEGKRIILNE